MTIVAEMTGWLSKVKDVFGVGAEVRARAVAAIKRAQSHTIELVADTRDPSDAYTAIIEQTRDADFIISQPSAGGLTHPLRTREQFLITIETLKGKLTGRSHVIGRYKTPSGGTGTIFGYRMSMPVELISGTVHDYRSSQRKSA